MISEKLVINPKLSFGLSQYKEGRGGGGFQYHLLKSLTQPGAAAVAVQNSHV